VNVELIRQLLQRVRSNMPSDRIVTADEASEWPEGEFDALLRDGVLQEVQPAATVECDACFERHVEVVEYVEEPPGSTLRAYIACPEAGRVKVDTDRMRRWEIQPSVLEQYVPAEPGAPETSEPSADVDISLWPPTARAFAEILRQAKSGGAPLHWSVIKPQLNAKGFYPDRAHDVRRRVPNWDQVIASPKSGYYQLKS
jgi:hypothetical protein